MNGGVEVASTKSCEAGSRTTVCLVVVAIVHSSCSAGDGLAEPVLEAGRGDEWAVARGERVLGELGAEVPCVDVGGHRAWVVVRAQDAAGELVEGELLRPREFDGAVHGRA